MSWVGYKVRLAESCDEGLPHLIRNVHMNPATATNVKQLRDMQEGLAKSGLLPAEQLADAAYVCGSNLVWSHARQIDLIEPTYENRSWQEKGGEGFEVANFRLDWEKKTVTCPEGRKSIRWSETRTARGQSVIHIGFSAAECAACPSRSSCTQAKNFPRPLTLYSQKKSTRPSVRFARKCQKTEDFISIYSQRAGIQGMTSLKV